jgi:hypothetical protein
VQRLVHVAEEVREEPQRLACREQLGLPPQHANALARHLKDVGGASARH